MRISKTQSALAAALFGATALGACSVSEPLEVRSATNASDPQRSAVTFAIAEEEAGTLRGRFAVALIDAFAARGVAAQSEARLVADYSVSEGSAEIGIRRRSDPDSVLEEGEGWIDPPRNSRRFDRCKARELRGTLVLVDRQTGALVYRGTGTATECEFDDAALRSLADGLVAESLAS